MKARFCWQSKFSERLVLAAYACQGSSSQCDPQCQHAAGRMVLMLSTTTPPHPLSIVCWPHLGGPQVLTCLFWCGRMLRLHEEDVVDALFAAKDVIWLPPRLQEDMARKRPWTPGTFPGQAASKMEQETHPLSGLARVRCVDSNLSARGLSCGAACQVPG